MSFRSACARNGPPAGLQAQLNSTQLNSTQLNSTQLNSTFERHLAASRSKSPNMSKPSAISTAILYTSETHICLERPRRRGADRFCKIKLLGWKMHRRRTSSSGSTASQVKSGQVSPNARRRAQCKGGGGKEKKYMYTKKCQTLYNLPASLRERRRNNYIEQKSRKHGKRESHRAVFLATISQLPKALYLQNISNFVSQVCCGRPRGGYVGRGCHASVLLTQRSAGKFAM